MLVIVCSCAKEPIQYEDPQKIILSNENDIKNYITQKGLVNYERIAKNDYFFYLKKNTTSSDSTQEYDGSTVTISFKVYDLNGKLLDSTKTNEPYTYVSNKFFVPRIANLLFDLRKGDKVSILCPYIYMSFDGDITPKRIEAEILNVQSEEEAINTYLVRTNNTDMLVSNAGVRYKITKKLPNAPSLTTGSSIDYLGEFLRPTQFLTYDYSINQYVYKKTLIFDKNVMRYDPKESLISGFTEALNLLKLGEEGTFVIPYSLAYGEKGISLNDMKTDYTMPPYSTLVFTIKTY
ncbi:MAG: FKBP-type peptidyl-prolyl cis-trans isomerase [Pseudarcicella sp.]|nr:FKBP-type peptidyl-prolyl cis-trans isomerase [Pseudarcicella sp.]